jgi:urease accessory protein
VMSDRALALTPAALAAMAFGFAHGHAHGVELGASGAGSAALAGILLATASLHGLGLLLGRTLRQSPSLAVARRGAGAGMAAFGAALLAGLA